MLSNVSEKRLFNFVVLAINYYYSIYLPIPIKSIFFWLDELKPFISLPTDLNHTKSKSDSDNCNIGRKSNEVS